MKKYTKQKIKEALERNIRSQFRTSPEKATRHQVYLGVCSVIKEMIIEEWINSQKLMDEKDPKIVYYMSMEFLTGRYLGNNMINIGAMAEVEEVLKDLGYSINMIEDEERDPALGNGGLGRLAACFLESLSSLGYAAYGCGIRYHYGMFRQKIENGRQVEVPDVWLEDGSYPFELKRPEYEKEVRFGGYVRMETNPEDGSLIPIHEGYRCVRAIPYDIPIIGYANGFVNALRVWDAEAQMEFCLDTFQKGDFYRAKDEEILAKVLSEVLYPNDSHMQGKELRLQQQYFFVSASVQEAVARYKRTHGGSIEGIEEKVIFQMNDTHPTVTIPELMRVLMDEEKLGWDEAWRLTEKMCAYTNHTIMSEALEKWPISLFSRLLPRVYQIVEEMNRRFLDRIRKAYPGDTRKEASMAILWNGEVRMANMAVAACFSVNGVAQLHTEILKERELRDFYELMPEKFNNKTDGVTQRRFLLHGNPLLSDWITEKIGDKWICDLYELKKLEAYAEDPKAQTEFHVIKRKNKERLAEYILEHNGIVLNPDSIFDIQCKRLHEYKRQLLNILHVLYLYQNLKDDPNQNFTPRTFIFGAKASAGYYRAKQIIELINAAGEKINNDPVVRDRLKVVFIEDYRVSNAELMFAAADVSEQISTASREASGTGNMKFMMNGALTLGTMDGANVEIFEEVGEENGFVFGLRAPEVMRYERENNYHPQEFLEREPQLKRVIDGLLRGDFSNGDGSRFRAVCDSLLHEVDGGRADMYFNIADFRAYARAQEEVVSVWQDQAEWTKRAILNVARSGKFSSDRCIREYAEELWHTKPIA